MPSFGILSPAAPATSGVATFGVALAQGLSARSATAGVVRIGDGDAAELLNQSDVAVVLHECGTYGDELIGVMDKLSVPSIVVAHAVLDAPTPQQLSELGRVMKLADQVVAMSETAHQTLADAHPDQRHKVVMISHDDPDASAWHAVTDGYLSVARRLVAARLAQA